MEIDVSEEQPQKAPYPIVVTESGSVMDVSEEQRQKAADPIVVTESGSVMDVSEEQPEKAWLPIVVTESGSVVDVSEEQPEKAPAATLVGTVSRKSLMSSRRAIVENLSAAPPTRETEQQSMNIR